MKKRKSQKVSWPRSVKTSVNVTPLVVHFLEVIFFNLMTMKTTSQSKRLDLHLNCIISLILLLTFLSIKPKMLLR